MCVNVECVDRFKRWVRTARLAVCREKTTRTGPRITFIHCVLHWAQAGSRIKRYYNSLPAAKPSQYQ